MGDHALLGKGQKFTLTRTGSALTVDPRLQIAMLHRHRLDADQLRFTALLPRSSGLAVLLHLRFLGATTPQQTEQQNYANSAHTTLAHYQGSSLGLVDRLPALTGVTASTVDEPDSKPPPSARCNAMRFSIRAWRAVIWALRPSRARC